MRVRLHNVGPIRDADIDVTDLCLLVGPNGSGKTTFSGIAYAAIQASNAAFRSARHATFLASRPRRADLATTVERALDQWEDGFRRSLELELKRCVARDLSLLGREGRAGKGAAPRIYVSTDHWCLVFRLDRDGLVVERRNRAYQRPLHDAGSHVTDSRELDRYLARGLRTGTPTRALYFPAARSGFMQTFGALTALVFTALGSGYFDQATVGSIPGTAADFLRFLAQLRTELPSRIEQDAIDVFERGVLKGRITLNSEETAREVLFQPEGFQQAWPIEAAATSAAELAPVILYLRHYARAGDGVFIDEPEAHFHPSSQVALARGLLHMAQHLRHVVIATHSEFLGSGFSNLLLEQRAKPDNGPPVVPLRVHEFCVGDDLREGVLVRELEFDPAEGFDIKQFSRVAETTYEEAVALYNAAHESS